MTWMKGYLHNPKPQRYAGLFLTAKTEDVCDIHKSVDFLYPNTHSNTDLLTVDSPTTQRFYSCIHPYVIILLKGFFFLLALSVWVVTAFSFIHVFHN